MENNLLPYDGEAYYLGRIMNDASSSAYFDVLLNKVEWRNDEAMIYGKHFITKRKVAWYGEQDYLYSYSNTAKRALPWFPELESLKDLAGGLSGESYNSCLLNLYHDGAEGMGWHSDDEKSIADGSAIASISFGAERRFSFRHRQSKEKISLLLENGSLLVMKGNTQNHWQHSLPKSMSIKTPRINLTFRIMI